ncbi:MAG: hypothetical protein MUC45_06330, partial [Actinomycetia bacterium]|nr:hypothetical protein [Actinomycetes bacterium]
MRRLPALLLGAALASAGVVAGPAVAAEPPTHTNGLIAFRCVQGSAVRWGLVDRDGSGLTIRGPAAGTFTGDLAWAPDGSELAYVGDIAGGTRSSILLAEADGTFPFAT